MKDVFYTLLVIWIIYRIVSSLNAARSKQAASSDQNTRHRKPGETTVDYIPPKDKNKHDDKGEYVDYEEIE
ncbi:MAG: hypothetical protein K0Q95_3088 [Bacteroidota bacterium]|jgi:hypothetical protein|nr:hypothetical protein [Bacteroidota bacterium]